MDEKYIQELYDQLGGKDKFGEYNDFRDLISSNADYQKAFHDEYGEKTLGAFNDFQYLVKKKDSTPLPYTTLEALPGQVDFSQPVSSGAQPSSEKLVTTTPGSSPEQLIINGNIPEPKPTSSAITLNQPEENLHDIALKEYGGKGIENLFTGLFDLGRKFISVLVHDTPANIQQNEAINQKTDFIDELIRKEPHKYGVANEFASDETRRKFAESVADKEYPGWRNGGDVLTKEGKVVKVGPSFTQAAISKKVAHLEKAKKSQEAANKFLGDYSGLKAIPKTWEEAKEKGSAGIASYIGGAFGNGLGYIPTSIATMGTSSYLMEKGGAYEEAVAAIAKHEGITEQEVIEKNLDQPAKEVAHVVGLINGALDLGSSIFTTSKALSIGVKNIIKKKATEELLKHAPEAMWKKGAKALAEPVTEYATEFMQGTNSQIGALLASGKKPEDIDWEKDIDWDRSREEGLQGLIGSAGIITGSHAVNALKGEKNVTAPEGDLGKPQANEKPKEQVEQTPKSNVPEVKQEESVQVQAEPKEQKEVANEPTGEAVKEEVREPVQQPKEESKQPASEEGVQQGEVSNEPAKEISKEFEDNTDALLNALNDGRKSHEQYKDEGVVQIEGKKGNYFLLKAKNKKGEAVFNLVDENGKFFEGTSTNWRRSEMVMQDIHELENKSKENAIQEPSASSVLQHPQEGVGEPRSERERVEPIQQGNETSIENQSEKEEGVGSTEATLGNNTEKPTIKEIADENKGRIIIAKPTIDTNTNERGEKSNEVSGQQSETFGKGFKVLGTNLEGNKVGEDSRGVRGVLKGNIVVSQPVNIVPGRGYNVSSPEGEFLTKEEAKTQADEIAIKHGFESPTHLLNSVKKRTGEEFENVQDVPQKLLNEVVKERSEPKKEVKQTEKTGNNQDDFVNEVSSQIGNEILSKRKLEKLGEENGITDKNEVKELTEYAIVQKAKELAKNNDFDGLVKLYEDQPSLTHRTNESISKQQYSTPAPIGYLMGKFVGLDKANNALEPSAGNGMLTIAGDPKIFTVNEIDDTRLNNLKKQGFGEVISQDGSQEFETGRIYDAVVTNPPFGGTNAVEFDGYKINELAQIMTIRALDVMKDNGKAAIIIGGNNKFDEAGRLTGRDRIFFNYLYHNYNVKDVIDVAGEIYRKQGASFPIRIILIDGRKATPSGAAPLEASFGEQERTFEGIKNRIEKSTSNENIQPTELVGNPTDVVRGGSTESNTEVRPEPVTSVPEGEIPAGSKRSTGTPGTVEKPSAVRGGNARSNGTKSGSSVDSGSNIEQQPITEPVNGEGQTNEQQPVEPGGIEELPETRTRHDRKIAEGVQSGESTVTYNPVSKGKAFDLMSPAGMKQEILDAQTDLLNDIGDVDTFVQKKLGYKDKAEMYDALGAEQIDGVALAIRNIERGTGIIIGDQTGVGKGRQAAAIIRYANQQGLTPIFLTEKPNLFSDLYRDLVGIKYGDITPFIVNSKGEKFNGISDEKGTIVFKAPSATDKVQKDFIRRGNVPDDASLILATYSQFSSPAYVDKINFLKNVAQNNIIILDEAHNASGDGNTSHLFQELLPSTKGVVYLSGTFAKRANNMPVYALKTSMREANVNTEELIRTIEGGGVALQEIISSQLAEAGEMIRRERTFKGIEVNNRVIGGNEEKVKTQQLKQANQVTDVMNDIIKFQDEHVKPVVAMLDDEAVKSGEKVVGREGTNMAGVDNTPYFSKVFNVINQLLYAIKAKETALFAIEELKAGRKPFIAIRSTMEAMLKDIVDRGDVKVGDAIDADFNFVLQKGLEGVMRVSRKDAQGKSIKEDIHVSDLSPQGQLEYKRIRSKIANLESGLNISPIDELVQTLNEAGYKVGEVTGRQMKLKLKGNKAILEHNKKEPVNELYRKFNNGDLDVIIVNSSGSTGASAHSDTKFKDQRQRSMLVLEPELNISTLVQMLGRVNRTGQINKPKYTFISSTIPAEQRLMMMTMRKLKSLDANTTSNQKQSNSLIEVPEIFNKYGDEVVIEYLSENPEIISSLGDPLKMLAGNEVVEPQIKEGAANKVTGRVAILPTDKQAAFYAEITDRYNKYINFLNDAGLNDLQVEYLPLKTKTLTKKPVILGKGGRSKFGEDTYLEEVEADNLKKPMTKQEIDDTMKDLGGFSNQFYQNQLQEYADKLYAEIAKSEGEKLKTKIDKINNSKETEEDKTKFINEAKELSDLQKDYKINKEKDTIKYLESLFKFFTPGRAIKMPKDFNETITTGLSLSDGIFLGFDINLKKNKPFVRSNVTLKFAVNDSRRVINLPSTKTPIIKNIRSDSYDLSASHQTHIVNDWDKLEKPKARSKRYIATGNILQGLSKYKGQIVKYSTDKGFINTGILMPEYFDPREDELNKQVSVPASKAAPIILSASNGDVFTGGGVTITKKSEHKYSIRVPKPKQTGGKFYSSPYINDLVDHERWDSVGAEMEAFTDSSRIEQLLDVLTDKFGVSFPIDAKKAAALIKEEGPEDPNPNNPLNKILSEQSKENVKENYEGFSGAMTTGIPIKPIGKIKKAPSDNALLELLVQAGITRQEAEKQLNEAVKVGDEEVDKRIEEAANPSPTNMENRFGEALTGVKSWATQHFKYLSAKEWPREANILREFETLFPWAKGNATQYVKTLVDGMTPNQYKVFSMKIILSDMLESIEKGLNMTGPDGKLPFGFKDELQVRKALKKYNDFANADARIIRSLEMREEFMNAFKDQLIKTGLLDENDIENYYHRRVLEYHAESEGHKSVLFGKDIADKKRDFQKRRKGTRGLDYSTNFLETEWKVVSEGLYEMEKQKILKDLVAPFEAKLKSMEADFEKEFSGQLDSIEKQFGEKSPEAKRFKEGKRSLKRNYLYDHIPEGYSFYRVSDENRLFWAKTVTQKNLDRAIEQAENNDQSGLSDALTIVDELIGSLKSGLMVGPKRKQYMIPTQLAEQLEELARNETVSAPTNLATQITSAWKQLMILSPTRLLRYNLNNTGSDVDRLVQVEPKILKYAKESTTELWNYLKTGETTPQLLEAMRGDVINSGFQISELADVSKEKWAQSLLSKDATIENILGKEGLKKLAIKAKDAPGNLWDKYMSAVSPYVQFRENILRYAAYKLASEKTSKGETFYWASDANAIRQIKDVRQKNAKLARDVFGDYMNLSQGAHQLRRVLLPFYSWFEVNMKTHYNLLKNASSPKVQREMIQSAVLRGIPSVAFRMAKAYVMMGLFTAAVEAWNKFAFGLYGGDDDTEKKLRESRIKGLQLIVGVSDDGKIRTIPIQGAFYDFIDFFGLWNIGDDVERIFTGDDKLKEAGNTAKGIGENMANKGAQLLTPLVKSPLELASGQSYYPNIFNPTPINDKWEYAFKSMTVGDEYNYLLSDKPKKESYLSRKFNNTLLREFDTEQLSYYAAKKIISDYEGSDTGGSKGEVENPIRASEKDAEYKFMLALRYGNYEEADKWLERYIETGGNMKKIHQKIKSADPFKGVKKTVVLGEPVSEWYDLHEILADPEGYKPQTHFGRQLTSEDKFTLKEAMKYYERLRGNKEKFLDKSKILN